MSKLFRQLHHVVFDRLKSHTPFPKRPVTTETEISEQGHSFFSRAFESDLTSLRNKPRSIYLVWMQQLASVILDWRLKKSLIHPSEFSSHSLSLNRELFSASNKSYLDF